MLYMSEKVLFYYLPLKILTKRLLIPLVSQIQL